MNLQQNQTDINYTTEKWLILFAVLVNVTGLLSPIWGVDANLYASISKTMVIENNYVELFSNGKDWLDKPHFTFWIVALFFKLFGFTALAYKLPAMIFVFAGAFYTYLLAKILYNQQVGYWAALILLTAQHIVVSNNDVRAEPYLLGLVIGSVYHFYIAYKRNDYLHLLTACLFTAFAIMTKGIFAIIPICGATAGELIIKKQWKHIFNWRWVLSLFLVSIFILPEIYCLYIQFDSHPEKIVFNSTNVSGIKFFFWDSQFGRFFNTGPIKGRGDITFFLHTILWAFLPWAILWYIAVYNYFKKNWHNVQKTEWICMSGSLLMLFVFSVSKFQLPHYINILLPFFSIITSQYISNLSQQKSIISLQIVQNTIIFISLLIIFLLNYFFKPQHFYKSYFFIEIILIIALILIIKQKKYTSKKLLVSSVLASFVINIYLNMAFYPSLVKYESGTQIGKYISSNYPEINPVYTSVNNNSDALMFNLNRNLTLINLKKIDSNLKKPYLFVGSLSDIDTLKNNGLKIKELMKTSDFHITLLNASFINYKTRNNNLDFKFLVVVK